MIIEMRSCLTRVNAGLVFILYRCFKKVRAYQEYMYTERKKKRIGFNLA